MIVKVYDPNSLVRSFYNVESIVQYEGWWRLNMMTTDTPIILDKNARLSLEWQETDDSK